MQQIDIKPIGSEPAPAALARSDDAVAARVMRLNLADQHDIIALPSDSFADQFF